MINITSRAEINGKLNEDWVVQQVLTTFPKIIVYDYKIFKNLKKENWPPLVIVKNYPTKRIFTPDGRSDFMLFIKKENDYIKCRIECRYQNSSGSVLEKIPTTLLDLKYSRPDDEKKYMAFLILEGKFIENKIDLIKSINKKINFIGESSGEVEIYSTMEFLKIIKKLINV